jgi:Fur family peroxide stress response transcriptional regulator
MARPFKYRDAILALLEENPVHPTVDWIHAQLRRKHPRVSLATVYRTLKTLVAARTLCELPFGTSESRFGLTLEQRHYHFICEKCQKILDLPTRFRADLERTVEAETGHVVSRHTVEFYGVCRECAAGQRSKGSSSRSLKRKE